jgi:LytR cell envelope-related transcriptional attenuator
MSGRTTPGGTVRPTRAARTARTQRARRGVALGVVAALVVAATGLWLVRRGDDGAAAATDGGSEDRSTSAETRMLALQVEGGPAPLLAVIGAPGSGAPIVMPVPAELTIVVPGQGETSAPGVAALPGDSMRIALSNMTGTWIHHFAVLSLGELAAMIEAAGGATVTLPSSYPTENGALGPGDVTLSGPQAKAFLAGATDDAGVRWEILLSGMLERSLSLPSTGSIETDDADAVSDTLATAQGAEVFDIPTQPVTGDVIIPVYPTLDERLAIALGTAAPVSTIVQNGSGEPGVGEAVGASIIPAGFRVVLSQNAQSFDVAATNIFSNGVDHEADARDAKAALGVGRIRVSQVPSGVGDITIVVGKDFTA